MYTLRQQWTCGFYLISWTRLIVKYECFVPNSDSGAVRMINGDLDNVCSRPKRKWTRWIWKQLNFKFCLFSPNWVTLIRINAGIFFSCNICWIFEISNVKSNPPNYAFDYFIMRSSTKCQCNWHLIIHKGAHTSQAFCVDFFQTLKYSYSI